MQKAAVLAIVVAAAACAPLRPDPAIPARTPPADLAERMAEADRLAARGCYLCLKEASAAYADLLALAGDPILAQKALENSLMIALREIELRLPDSGAREAADRLQAEVPGRYEPYFAALDALANLAPAGRGSPRAAALRTLAATLEREWPASPMKAYFYLATALRSGSVNELKSQIAGMLDTHGDDLSLQYRVLAFLPLYSDEAARALIGRETGFGEVHFLIGQQALLNGEPAAAHRELTRALELLPDSASISIVLANVLLSYARYAEALALYDRALARVEDEGAALGRARALSYLKRHDEAIAALDELLLNLRNNPGEKYYWLAWNRLRLGESSAAYDAALSALKAMRNSQVFNLAGIAAFNLNRLTESREHFRSALEMNPADCDSERYLGQIDSFERQWHAAAGRFSEAAACYVEAIARMRGELAKHEQDITGLSNGLIRTLRGEIEVAETLRANAAGNATVAAANAGEAAK